MLQTYNPKNKDLIIYVGGELVHRDEAKISVFDSVVQGGDAVWEGLRLYTQGILCLDKHLTRLQESAGALLFKDIPSNDTVRQAISDTLELNQMTGGVHIRLTLTRGEKITSGMDPRLNQKGCTLIILPEYKEPVYNQEGIRIITSTIRRNGPQFLDSKIHHNNLLNNIQAKIQANQAGADAALMLDPYGFVSELNGTNIFHIKNGVVYTPTADACLPGITRAMVIELLKKNNITCIEKNISLTELYNADEVFTTGTMGELTPINEIDGRKIKNKGNMFGTIVKVYNSAIPDYCVKI